MSDRRVQILHAALPVFSAKGFAGASTRALAAAASVNVATLAYHFGDKQGLYDAVVDWIYDRLLAIELPSDLGVGPVEQIHRLVAVLYAHARTHRDGIRLLLRHVMEQGGSPQRVRDQWSVQTLARAAQVLGRLDLPTSADLPLPLPLVMLSLNHLIARYAVTDPQDLVPFVQGQDPEQAVARHLGEVACCLLGVTPAQHVAAPSLR